MEYITESAEETKNLGKTLAADLKSGGILALVGDLGSGKTTFVQGIAEGLGIKGRIISPTFILMRRYELPEFLLYHIDLYRLEEKVDEEVRNLGIMDIWKEGKDITVVEWAEKIKDMIPPRAKWISFESIGEEKRKITIHG